MKKRWFRKITGALEIKPKRQVLEIPIEPLHGRIKRAIIQLKELLHKLIINTYQLNTTN